MSFLDFSPYVSFFERYEKYITDFLEGIQDNEKIEMIKDLTSIFERHIDMLKYFPADLRNLTCDNPQVCAGHEDKFCFQWYVSTCMNRQHYEHMVEEVKYLKEVFEHVKETFFQAINHVSSHSGETDLTNNTFHTNHMTRNEARYLKDEIATMASRRDRKKRFVEWGAMIALGYGVYSNAEDIKTIKENIKVLQNENKRQDRNINTLARYLRRIIYRVKLHDQMLLGLTIRLIRLKYNLMGHMHLANYNDFTTMILRDAGFTMSRLLTRLTAATQNAEAVYNYLRVMASHKLDPTVVPVPQLIKILEEVEKDIKGSPRLTLPIDPKSGKVEEYYNIIRVTPHIIQDLLVVLVTIPLTDVLLQMNVYQVHNLPAVHPKLNISPTYELEGKYLAVGQDGHYLALPSETDLGMCLITGGGLCKMSQALYLSDRVIWCIYALFKEDQAAIDKQCTYSFKKRTGYLAHSLGGYLWAIRSLATEKLQVRCLKEMHILEIKPALQIVLIGDGCEGYSPSLATAAKNEITAINNFINRPGFFIRFNAVYRNNPTIELWKHFSFQALSEEAAKAMVDHLPELEDLPIDAIEQSTQELFKYSTYHFQQWVFLIIMGMGIVGVMVGLGYIIWKVYKMRGTFREAKQVLFHKPNLTGLMEAGQIAQRALRNDQPAPLSDTGSPEAPALEPAPVIPRSEPIPIPKPRRKLNVYKAIEEEFAKDPQGAKQYLKLKKLGTIPESDYESQTE